MAICNKSVAFTLYPIDRYTGNFAFGDEFINGTINSGKTDFKIPTLKVLCNLFNGNIFSALGADAPKDHFSLFCVVLFSVIHINLSLRFENRFHFTLKIKTRQVLWQKRQNQYK